MFKARTPYRLSLLYLVGFRGTVRWVQKGQNKYPGDNRGRCSSGNSRKFVRAYVSAFVCASAAPQRGSPSYALNHREFLRHRRRSDRAPSDFVRLVTFFGKLAQHRVLLRGASRRLLHLLRAAFVQTLFTFVQPSDTFHVSLQNIAQSLKSLRCYAGRNMPMYLFVISDGHGRE